MPTATLGGVAGDGYGYDVAINPAKNVLLTSSFAGAQNYMRELGELIKDPAAMKHFGSTMVVWNLKSMQPLQVLSVPGAPLEIRWSLVPGQSWAITAAALTSKLWLIKPGEDGAWTAKEVATHRRAEQGAAAGGHLPQRGRHAACGSTPSWTAPHTTSTSPIRSIPAMSTRSASAARST